MPPPQDETEGERFEAAFDRLFPRAVRVGIRILGDVGAAEDVAAEALARAHSRWRRLARVRYRDGWVLRTAANLAVDAARRRHPTAMDEAVQPAFEEQTVLRLALVDALGRLPRRQREAITLRFLCGFSEAETAGVMQVAVGTVKATVNHGMRALRTTLAAAGEEVGDDLA